MRASSSISALVSVCACGMASARVIVPTRTFSVTVANPPCFPSSVAMEAEASSILSCRIAMLAVCVCTASPSSPHLATSCRCRSVSSCICALSLLRCKLRSDNFSVSAAVNWVRTWRVWMTSSPLLISRASKPSIPISICCSWAVTPMASRAILENPSMTLGIACATRMPSAISPTR